ncbi:hypothetical protein [Paraburkholderia sp. HD33-4]|nr:hypothetical protein [Paraburkholderia sp. HD33-4]
MLSLALLVAAFVLFLMAALSVPVPRINLVGAGLAVLTLVQIVAVFVSK